MLLWLFVTAALAHPPYDDSAAAFWPWIFLALFALLVCIGLGTTTHHWNRYHTMRAGYWTTYDDNGYIIYHPCQENRYFDNSPPPQQQQRDDSSTYQPVNMVPPPYDDAPPAGQGDDRALYGTVPVQHRLDYNIG